MNPEQDQQLIKILQEHYKHPERLELNKPYLSLYKKLKEFINETKKQ